MSLPNTKTSISPSQPVVDGQRGGLLLANDDKVPRTATASASGELTNHESLPTLVVSPSHRIQRVSTGLQEAWNREPVDLVGQDVFVALYKGSPTERFDRIPLSYAIENAALTRSLQICHAAHIERAVSWTARILPVYEHEQLLCYVFEWERTLPQIAILDVSLDQTWLSMDNLVQSVKDYAIFLLDTRGNVVTWNTGAELTKGYKKEEIVGKHFSVFYGEPDILSGKPEKELEICLREGRFEDEGWRYRKDGTRFWADVVLTAIYKDNVHVGFGKVSRNLTERKAEMRLIAAHEESAKLKNDFLANIGHEIRTPMHEKRPISAALGQAFTPLSGDPYLVWNYTIVACIIEESGHVLLQVINDILDYSKLAAGGFSISKGVVDVSSVISTVVRSVQPTIQLGVSLELGLEPGLPRVVEGDSLRYRQIAENIIGNAGKFTDSGSIIVRVAQTAQDDQSHTILTEVTDTGQGVSEDAAKKLFKPFSQLDTTYQKRRQGTGLGLSISKSLVELMDGQIGFRPNPAGRGSIFWFLTKFGKLELDRQALATARSEPGSRSAQTPGAQSKSTVASKLLQLKALAPSVRILAAEDNIINQRVLLGLLQGFGFKNITIVPDGAQAVEALFVASEGYDLVLMDVSVPVMNGYEATLRIRECEQGTHVPIVAMTAYALKGDMEQCLEKKMDDYIAKPMNKHVLMEKLLKWLMKPGQSQ